MKEKITESLAAGLTILIYGGLGYIMGRAISLLITFFSFIIFDNEYKESLQGFGLCGFILLATLAAGALAFQRK